MKLVGCCPNASGSELDRSVHLPDVKAADGTAEKTGYILRTWQCNACKKKHEFRTKLS
jgi:hypothetical protein